MGSYDFKKTSAGIFIMPTYPSLKSMKLYATFPLSLLLCFLIFSLVMAEEDQRKEIPQEQSLPSIEQQSKSYLLIPDFYHLKGNSKPLSN